MYLYIFIQSVLFIYNARVCASTTLTYGRIYETPVFALMHTRAPFDIDARSELNFLETETALATRWERVQLDNSIQVEIERVESHQSQHEGFEAASLSS